MHCGLVSPSDLWTVFVVVVFVDATEVSVFLCSVSESPLGERLLVEVVRQQCHKYF